MAHRSDEILNRLPEGQVIGAEIGVFAGATSARLLRREDLSLYMIDTWDCFLADGIVIADYADQKKNYNKAIDSTDAAAERRFVIQKRSLDAALDIEDESLDFVFIDGDHSYVSVNADINAWKPKLKRDGLLCGHDYANKEYLFGDEVKKAVDRAVKANGWELDLGSDYTWFVRV